MSDHLSDTTRLPTDRVGARYTVPLRGVNWGKHAGVSAIALFALVHWLLIGLANGGLFQLWPIVLPVLLLAGGGALVAWWRPIRANRLAMLLIVVVGILLYTPPAEQLALSGDAAIYPNEAAMVARSGGFVTSHDALAALPPPDRDLFYISSAEQFPTNPIQSYAGMVYGGYYVVNSPEGESAHDDPTAFPIQISRMPLSTVWLALIHTLGGMQLALYSTPFFAILSLLVLYQIGLLLYKHSQPTALWAVLLVALCYPQIHFGRATYAEMYGQFWTLAGVLCALYWIERRHAIYLLLAFFCWTTTWAGRLDALILLGGVGLLLLYVGLARDRRTLIAVTVALPVYAVLIWMGTNGVYVGATYEILERRWFWFGGALLGLCAALPLLVAMVWVWGKQLLQALQRLAPVLHGLLFCAVAFVVLWSTIPNPWRDAEVFRYYQEIIWFSSQYISPLFYWLALLGVTRLLVGGYDQTRFFVLMLFLSLGLVFFARYTSAWVYPVSLRRLISDVIPMMALVAGFAVATPWRLPRVPLLGERWLRGIVMVVALLWVGWLSRPLLSQHEGINTIDLLQEVHKTMPAEAVLLFETQDGDSWVGWLAAPLYSLYDRWALLLESDTPDPAAWQRAVDTFVALERPVYVVTQQEQLPNALLPAGYTATLTGELIWQSSLIGQTEKPYPPPYWRFAHPLRFYQLTRTRNNNQSSIVNHEWSICDAS